MNPPAVMMYRGTRLVWYHRCPIVMLLLLSDMVLYCVCCLERRVDRVRNRCRVPLIARCSQLYAVQILLRFDSNASTNLARLKEEDSAGMTSHST